MTKLLTVDDEIEFTNLIKNYFSARGYEVFTAHKGDDALLIASKVKPDIYLIDLKMPGMHGDEVLKKILSNDPKAKCIMITASEGEDKVRSRLLSIGAYTCFDKPISSLRDLEQKIREALNGS
jgi:DNA-binding response OmpR family regulator